MLCEIKIENVAVIEKAAAVFSDGLNVLSGETGAGKSILIDSINAILGNRTSREIVRSHTPKAMIWATFRGIGAKTRAQLADAGYEAENELLLYREITAEGKSTCRINGMPATASVVRDICSGLINIHGQHDNQSLMNPARHLGILDSFAQNETAHGAYYVVYKELCRVKKEIDALSMDETEKERRIETLRFQIEEIGAAELRPGEEDELLNRRTLIRNAQTVTEQLNIAYAALSGAEDAPGAGEMLGSAATALESISSLSEDFAPLAEQMSGLYYTARDAASDIADILARCEFDPQALDAVEERLDLIYRMKQKYGGDVQDILAYLDAATAELDGIETGAQRLDELYDRQAALYDKAKALADALTQTRLEAFERFNAQITDALRFLNMPGIRFTLSHKKGPLAGSGQDSVEFNISTNPGEEPKPLAKIASGGELSRIMLAVKSALADKDDIGTVIYDEIDTGVSGLAAGRIGEKLKQTAQGRQVICITHTAQIAAQADNHLLIRKNVSEDRTYTEIDALSGEGRVQELARMISGDKITELALANAREMLRMAKA
ncbi:DNA repair protein RecN [Subdoligranulum sp. AM23-21AC]|uniref:DNA repair protein RecN n=1 Tax=Ruthenibacterium lactatiformans TaxID=1550024 RepID=UPI000E3EF600|nr:DNA repair protein RecN [Ruthenibacterium lactatiformans]RGD22326.1 DNA repair protein RecN [Subdoligranulum sp. AM23-21AC]RJW35075.1 DNA repair protein RecN [Subdoligranulum sp. TF05-17AC]